MVQHLGVRVGEKMKKKLVFILGTRPEVIKLAPVIYKARDLGFKYEVWSIEQHTGLLALALDSFTLKPTRSFGVKRNTDRLSDLLDLVRPLENELIEEDDNSAVIVQGDTMTTYLGALSAFLAKKKIVHVEAGLRTDNLGHPFPEEGLRQMVSRIVDLHCAATSMSFNRLLSERLSGKVAYTGNTIVDAINIVIPKTIQKMNRVYMTIHRRENGKNEVEGIFRAVKDFALMNGRWEVIFPCHPSPRIRNEAERMLSGLSNISVIDPLEYRSNIKLLAESSFVVTDSGGIQEEAGVLGIPTLVCRETTERSESVFSGTSKLVGSHPVFILNEMNRLANDQEYLCSMSVKVTEYGDGKSSERILKAIEEAI